MKRHTHAATLDNFNTELYLLRSVKFLMLHFKLAGLKFEIHKVHVLSGIPENRDPSGTPEKPKNRDPSGTLEKLENRDPSGTPAGP